MAEKTETKKADKQAGPDTHEFRVRTGRVYRHNGNTYRGGAVLFLTMEEGSASRDALRLVKDSN